MKNLEENLGGVPAMSDENLLKLCVKFGARALKWRGKFLGLLPEANRRRLFEKKGFNSIFEFAYRLAGLSEEQVRLVLRLELKFEDKPALKGLLVAGEVSVSKLARVAAVATTENEQEWAQVVNTLPRGALETLVRDHRASEAEMAKGIYEDHCADGFSKQNGLHEALFEGESVPGHGLNFEISEEVVKELNHLNFQGHDVNKIILELLENRRAEIQRRKEELGKEAIEKATRAGEQKWLKQDVEIKASRYISVKIRKVLKEEYGTKCSIPHCCKPAKGDHHSQRLSLVGYHDPRYIAPMCKEHHQIAHLIDQKYVEKRRNLDES